MANIALAFAVLEITDSASALGQVLAAHTIPVVLFLLGGGVIADRFPRAVVLQVSNVVSGALQGVIALLVITRTAEIWMLVVLTAFQGVASAIAFPAMASIMPQLVPREQLQQANALISLLRGSLNVLGPTVGALLVVTVGAGWALMADALTWFVAALLLLPVKIPRLGRLGPGEPERHRRAARGLELLLADDLAVGRGDRLLLPQRHPLRGDLHPRPDRGDGDVRRAGLGLVLSAESAGLIVMTIVLLRVPLQRPLLLGMLGISPGLPILMLGVRAHLLVMIVALFVAGAGTEVFWIGWNLAMQENIDEQMLSRAYSYDALGSFVAIPVGQLTFGPLAAAFGYRDVLIVSGVCTSASACSPCCRTPCGTCRAGSRSTSLLALAALPPPPLVLSSSAGGRARRARRPCAATRAPGRRRRSGRSVARRRSPYTKA